MKSINDKGFTLLEILLVIAAIGILAAIVIVAINPQRQLAQVRDAERQSSVNTLKKALDQYLIDEGEYPNGITEDLSEICNTGSNQVWQGSVNSDCLDLRVLVPTYLAAIPEDPSGISGETGYVIHTHTTNQKISIYNPFSEMNKVSFNPDLVEKDLIAYWGFDETTGNVSVDLSGNGRDGVFSGGFTFDTQSVPGAIGLAADLDGNDSFEVSSSIGLDDISVSVWVRKIVQDGSHDTIIATDRFRFGTRPNGGSRVGYWPKADFVGYSTMITLNEQQFETWDHLVLVQNGNTVRSYKDAILIDTDTIPSSGSINDISVGIDTQSGIGGTDPFIGSIDDLRVYDRTLTESEIELLFLMKE